MVKITTREIYDKVELLDKGLSENTILLENHLKHHEKNEKWLMFWVPVIVALINILTLIIFRYGGLK